MSEKTSRPGSVTNYINKDGLNQLLSYQYKAGTYSFGDNLMQPFWNWFVTLLPMSMAPNMVTLLGLIFNFTALAVYLALDTTMTKDLPLFAYMWAAICLFLYQTLDACDGKQARRTGSSSPLGQLFDHGCDAITTCLMCYLFCQSLCLAKQSVILTLTVYISSGISFYLAQWEEFFTHKLRSNLFGVLGVTEIQWTTIMTILINGFTDHALEKITISTVVPSLADSPIGQIKLLILFCMAIALSGLTQTLQNFYTVFMVCKGKNLASAFASSVPCLLWVAAVIILWLTTDFAEQHPSFAMLMMTPAYSLMNSRMIVCNFTHMDVAPLAKSYFWYLLFPINRYLLNTIVPEWQLALFIFSVTLVWYSLFVVCTIGQICSILNIHCLSIKKRPVKTAGSGESTDSSPAKQKDSSSASKKKQ